MDDLYVQRHRHRYQLGLYALYQGDTLMTTWHESWSAITVPAATSVAACCPSPRPEYGLILWWGWDGPMSEEVIIRDLDEIRERGVRCVMVEAGYGMTEPYLSSGWFELVRLAVEHARRRDMRVYLVDEGKYPSGFAGGKFSAERPDLRMQGLDVAERVPVAPGETLVRSLPPEVVGALARASGKSGWSITASVPRSRGRSAISTGARMRPMRSVTI